MFNVIADPNGANIGLNFNSAHGGNRTFTVRHGWTVKVVFSKASSVPHGVVVPEGETELKYDEVSSAFPGAFSSGPPSGVEGHNRRRSPSRRARRATPASCAACRCTAWPARG